MFSFSSVGKLGGPHTARKKVVVSASTANALYDCRLVNSLRSDYPVLRIRRSSDNTESDFYANASGTLVTTLANGNGDNFDNWIGSATAYVTTWYDQSGNGRNATQTTTNLQPIFVHNSTSAAASFVNFATGRYLVVASGTIPYNTSYTVSARHGSIGNIYGGICGTGSPYLSNKCNNFRRNDGNYSNYWWGNDMEQGSYGVGNIVTWVYDHSTTGTTAKKTILYVNGTSAGESTRNNWACTSTSGYIGSTTTFGRDETLTGGLYRVYIYGRVVTSTERTAMEKVQADVSGI